MTKMQHQEGETTIRTYLLGLAPPEMAKRIEERLLTDSDYLNGLERIAECLTDEYVRGEMKGIEKEQFNRHFLMSSEHREGLEFAKLLDRYFSEQNAASNLSLMSVPKWRRMMEIVLAVSAIVLMAALVLSIQQVWNLRREEARLQQERATANERQRSLAAHLTEQQQLITRLTHQIADLKKPGDLGDPDIVSLSLNPGLVRTGTSVNRTIIPAHVQAIRLELKLQGLRRRNYRAQVETAEGEVVWTANDLIPHPTAHRGQKAVILVLPVAPITRSQYLVRLTKATPSGTAEIVGTYYLNVTRK